MKNKITSLFKVVLLTMVLALALCTLVSAEQVYNGQFIKNDYTLYSVQGIILGSHEFCAEPLGGKTRVSFDICADSLDAEGIIAIESQKPGKTTMGDIITFDFIRSGAGVAITPTNGDKCVLEIGLTYGIVADIDLNSLVYDLVVYKGQGHTNMVCYQKSLAIDSSCAGMGIKSITNDTAGVTMTDLAVVRERISAGTPIIDMDNNIATVGVTLGQNLAEGNIYDVFVAFYSSDRSKLIHTEKSSFEYNGYDDYIEVSFALNEYFRGQYPVSVFVLRQDNACPVSVKTENDISNGKVNVPDYFAYTGFESDETYSSSTSVSGGKVPKSWPAGGWGGNSAPYDIAIESGTNGGYMSIGSLAVGQVGIQSPMADLPAGGISVSFEYKASSAYAGNRPRLMLLYYTDTGAYKSSENKVFYDISSEAWLKGEWFIDPSRYPEGVSKFRMAFTTSFISSLGETPAGRLMYDNLRVEDCTFRMECDEELSWYNLGDTVVYKAKGTLSSNIVRICGNVYNSSGELVKTVSCSRGAAQNVGWQYKPTQSGFYNVVFYALSKYNTITYEKMEYKAYYDSKTGKIYYIEKGGHDFYVSAFTNPANENRNDLYGMSILPGDGQYDMDIADKLGMSFLRLHAFNWMNIESADVTKTNGKSYNWSPYDYLFSRIRDGLKFRVIGNILGTPKWASPSDDESGSNFPRYASYAPTDNQYLVDFIDDLYARYGEYIDTWEIYNEPHINGGSVFWHDTTENFVNMLAAAYNELKKLSNNQDTVVMGGIGARRYLPFYRQFLSKGGWNYTDKLPMHGYDLDPWQYFKVNEEYGLSEKGIINTEGHVVLFNGSTTNVNYTEKQIGLRLLNEYFRQIKYGVERIAFFQAYDNNLQAEDVKIINSLVDGWSVVAAGLFRKKPYFQPRFAAGVLNTLIAKSGKHISYADEFKTGNVNIVKLIADDEPLYIIWADDLSCGEEADLSGVATFADIVDWEGREVPASGFGVDYDTVYFVTGLADDAFGYLESAQGTEVYNGKVVNSENEMYKKENSGPKLKSSTVSIFDHSNGKVNDDAGVEWNDTYLGRGTNLNAKTAVFVNNDGLEFVMRFDNTSNLKTALIYLGIDTFANGVNSDVVELEGIMNTSDSENFILKIKSPDFGGDLPSASFTPSGKFLSDGKAYMIESGDYIYCSMFVPLIQLYPYMYNENGCINLGFEMKGYESSNEIIRCYFDKSLYSVSKPEKYASFEFTKPETDIDDDYKQISIPYHANPGEYVSVSVTQNGESVYLDQYQTNSDGNCTIVVCLPKDKQYEATIFAVSTGYTIKDINTQETK